jgi:hypothetical protein
MAVGFISHNLASTVHDPSYRLLTIEYNVHTSLASVLTYVPHQGLFFSTGNDKSHRKTIVNYSSYVMAKFGYTQTSTPALPI